MSFVAKACCPRDAIGRDSSHKHAYHSLLARDPITCTVRLLFLSVISLSLLVTLNAKNAGEGLRSKDVPAELSRIAWTIGVWDTDTSYRRAREAPTFQAHSVQTVVWSPNRQFILTDERGLMPDGWKNNLIITTWNPVSKDYRLAEIGLTGEIGALSMVIDGDQQSILYYRPFEGRLIRFELKRTRISDTEYIFRCECTDGGTTWVCREGKAKKRLSSR
jgi:hypothetical protein